MKDKLMVIIFISILAFFSIGYIALEDSTISSTERRNLMTLEKLNTYSLVDASFSGEMEKYMLDQVPFRDTLRTLKAKVVIDGLQQLDTNGLYFKEGHWFKQDGTYHQKNIDIFCKAMQEIFDTYPMANNYVGIVPDKSYYIQDKNPFVYDYTRATNYIQTKLKSTYLELSKRLSSSSYYYSDPHVKQEAYLSILPYFKQTLQLGNDSSEYTRHSYQPFYGAYSGQAIYNDKYDILQYYSNETIDTTKVTHIEYPDKTKVYDQDGLTKIDSYTVFMSGPSAFCKIENPKATNTKTALLIRDSYGSSLAPLLIEEYQTIYMIDLRYVSFSQAKEYLPSSIDDILVFYGMQSINQSSNIKQ